MSEHDVDGELWSLLDLASDEELEDVHNILYGAFLALSCTFHNFTILPALQWSALAAEPLQCMRASTGPMAQQQELMCVWTIVRAPQGPAH